MKSRSLGNLLQVGCNMKKKYRVLWAVEYYDPDLRRWVSMGPAVWITRSRAREIKKEYTDSQDGKFRVTKYIPAA